MSEVSPNTTGPDAAKRGLIEREVNQITAIAAGTGEHYSYGDPKRLAWYRDTFTNKFAPDSREYANLTGELNLLKLRHFLAFDGKKLDAQVRRLTRSDPDNSDLPILKNALLLYTMVNSNLGLNDPLPEGLTVDSDTIAEIIRLDMEDAQGMPHKGFEAQHTMLIRIYNRLVNEEEQRAQTPTPLTRPLQPPPSSALYVTTPVANIETDDQVTAPPTPPDLDLPPIVDAAKAAPPPPPPPPPPTTVEESEFVDESFEGVNIKSTSFTPEGKPIYDDAHERRMDFIDKNNTLVDMRPKDLAMVIERIFTHKGIFLKLTGGGKIISIPGEEKLQDYSFEVTLPLGEARKFYLDLEKNKGTAEITNMLKLLETVKQQETPTADQIPIPIFTASVDHVMLFGKNRGSQKIADTFFDEYMEPKHAADAAFVAELQRKSTERQRETPSAETEQSFATGIKNVNSTKFDANGKPEYDDDHDRRLQTLTKIHGDMEIYNLYVVADKSFFGDSITITGGGRFLTTHASDSHPVYTFSATMKSEEAKKFLRDLKKGNDKVKEVVNQLEKIKQEGTKEGEYISLPKFTADAENVEIMAAQNRGSQRFVDSFLDYNWPEWMKREKVARPTDSTSNTNSVAENTTKDPSAENTVKDELNTLATLELTNIERPTTPEARTEWRKQIARALQAASTIQLRSNREGKSYTSYAPHSKDGIIEDVSFIVDNAPQTHLLSKSSASTLRIIEDLAEPFGLSNKLDGNIFAAVDAPNLTLEIGLAIATDPAATREGLKPKIWKIVFKTDAAYKSFLAHLKVSPDTTLHLLELQTYYGDAFDVEGNFIHGEKGEFGLDVKKQETLLEISASKNREIQNKEATTEDGTVVQSLAWSGERIVPVASPSLQPTVEPEIAFNFDPSTLPTAVKEGASEVYGQLVNTLVQLTEDPMEIRDLLISSATETRDGVTIKLGGKDIEIFTLGIIDPTLPSSLDNVAVTISDNDGLETISLSKFLAKLRENLPPEPIG